jgi:hypothetical protein
VIRFHCGRGPQTRHLDSCCDSRRTEAIAVRRREESSCDRRSYPYKTGGKKQQHLLDALKAADINELRRKCEIGREGRRAACSLFWTLGPNQVGKAAIIGWRDVLAPAWGYDKSVVLWPFDGSLDELLKPGNILIVETYPAECYGWFFQGGLRGKKADTEVRKRVAGELFRWAGQASLKLDPELTQNIEQGFPDGDDAFDATVGLFGMLEVLRGERKSGDPKNENVRKLEGWILGRQSGSGGQTLKELRQHEKSSAGSGSFRIPLRGINRD